MKKETEVQKVEREAYKRGYIAGLTAYAYWDDGRQYVGNDKTLLATAIFRAEDTYNFVKEE